MQSVRVQSLNGEIGGVALSVRSLRHRHTRLDFAAVVACRMTQVDQEVEVGNRPVEKVVEEGNCCLVEAGTLVRGETGQVGRADDLQRMEAYWKRTVVDWDKELMVVAFADRIDSGVVEHCCILLVHLEEVRSLLLLLLRDLKIGVVVLDHKDLNVMVRHSYLGYCG